MGIRSGFLQKNHPPVEIRPARTTNGCEHLIRPFPSVRLRRLAEGFTFTSPAPDDHLPADKFKAKCWSQAEHIAPFDFVRILGDGNSAFALIHVVTQDNRIVRNTEYFTFENGKIKSIEVFFGGNGLGFPTNRP
jgi:hypothetical protein